MNQLEERLRTAGRSYSELGPDVESIRSRGLRIRRNRQIGTSLAAVVLVAAGGVATFSILRPGGDVTVVSASEGEATGGSDIGQPDSSDTNEDGENVDETTSPDASADDRGAVTDPDDSVDDSAEAVDVDGDEGSADSDEEAANESDLETAPPSPSSLADGTGGWLTATAGGIEHLRADGSAGMITFPQPPGGFAQRWPTDVVRIDGAHYLLVDQFLNRSDLAAEREQALAESYGVPYDVETGAAELWDVATPEELDTLNHWEISILAVDLATDEIITVENRVVNAVQSPDWYYNGHITSDGSNILVMRELWQGYCLYAEGLTLDGRLVDIVDAKIYAKPRGVESMTFAEIGAVFSTEAGPPQPCRTADELPYSGLGVWGTQADSTQMEAFRTAFFEAGLG